MSAAFLIFEDRKAVQISQIVSIQALDDEDIDPRTGHRPRPMPENAQTRVDTRSGFFWTSTPFDDVIEQLILATHPLTGDAHG